MWLPRRGRLPSLPEASSQRDVLREVSRRGGTDQPIVSVGLKAQRPISPAGPALMGQCRRSPILDVPDCSRHHGAERGVEEGQLGAAMEMPLREAAPSRPALSSAHGAATQAATPFRSSWFSAIKTLPSAGGMSMWRQSSAPACSAQVLTHPDRRTVSRRSSRCVAPWPAGPLARPLPVRPR